jgi:hypothetical protein
MRASLQQQVRTANGSDRVTRLPTIKKCARTDAGRTAYSPWAEKGSKRRLWNERSVSNAINYVINGQGNDRRDFDK